jgi:hypothetical protein
MRRIHFCKGCKAPIVWLKSESGKNIPCQAKRISIVTDVGKVVQGYEPHWGNCPNEEQFRGRKSKSK